METPPPQLLVILPSALRLVASLTQRCVVANPRHAASVARPVIFDCDDDDDDDDRRQQAVQTRTQRDPEPEPPAGPKCADNKHRWDCDRDDKLEWVVAVLSGWGHVAASWRQ